MVTGNSNKIVIPKSYRGLQVLLVGNATSSLVYVKSTLEQYSYKVTWEESPGVALSLVGEDEEESNFYDMVITEMDLMEVDDFRFFNHIILNTELPIILMSCDENNESLRKAVNQAACFFLRKPICPRVLASVWQHVFRVRRMQTLHCKQLLQDNYIWEGNNIEINGVIPQVESIVDATGMQNHSNNNSRSMTNREKEDCLRKTEEELVKNQEKEDYLMRTDEDDYDKIDSEDERLNKKPRMTWTDELRLKFEKAMRTLGEEKARPKEILKLMGESNVTLRHVSSHLQKYREKRKRAGIGMKKQYQKWKPRDLQEDAGAMIQPTQQHPAKSTSVHYQIDMIKKRLDKANGKKTSSYDDLEGHKKSGCYIELMVERSSMHASNLNGSEANRFHRKEFSENISTMILNQDIAAAFDPHVPDIYEDYLAPNKGSDLFNHLNMDMGFILSEPNSSGMLEDIIFSSQRLGN